MVNRDMGARRRPLNMAQDFSSDPACPSGYQASGFRQQGLAISFKINDVDFTLNTVGRHNMENALAASAVASQLGVSLATCAAALESYEGIWPPAPGIGEENMVSRN